MGRTHRLARALTLALGLSVALGSVHRVSHAGDAGPGTWRAGTGPVGGGGLEELSGASDGSEVEIIEAPGARPSGTGLEEQSDEPRYILEDVVVVGNRKTRTSLILKDLGLEPGDVVTPADPRVSAARLRLLALGYFLDVQLSLAKGPRRGTAILEVRVEERGTIILNGLFLGTSEATALWGGLDMAETNFLGRGILLSGGFVHSTQPTVPGAEPGQAYRLQLGAPVPDLEGPWLSASFLYSQGSEFFRAFGDPGEVDPLDHVAVNTRRIGGRLGIGFSLSRITRLTAETRLEGLHAALPRIRTRDLGGGRALPIDFSIGEGDSRLSSLLLSLDVDTRDDPFLPRTGQRLLFSFETALAVAGSHYAFSKGVLHWSRHFALSRGRHGLSVHGLAGVISGAAPYFDRFFIADLNALLPSRALGLSFSTLPSRNLLGTSVDERRFDDYAGRVMVEYAAALWRGRGFLYRADLFAGVGIFALTSAADLRLRTGPLYGAIPMDLTADFGLRLDTLIGIFNISVANALGRIPY